jgi:hypothetical protein
MSDAREIKKTAAEELLHADNVALNEAAWQKWVDKNKERDAARRRKLIRLLWLVLSLLLVCGVVWWLAVSK